MDPQADPSNLYTVQRPDEAIPFLAQPGQPAHGSFANAHDFQIDRPRFYDVQGDFHQHSGKTEHEKLKKFISDGASYDSIARSPPPICYPGTRLEVLKTIRDWIDEPDPRERIFWLNGPAGTGKSAITQTIAESCKDTRLAGSFFFQRNTLDRGKADRLFLTLAWQLAESIPEILPHLESTLKAEHLINAKSINVQFDLLIVQVFEKLICAKPDLRLQKSLVIIDAVDECGTDLDDQTTILALIGAQMSKRFPLRFLISSRPEPRIEETFDKSIMKSVTRTLVLDNKFAQNGDIQRYLEAEFNRIFTGRQIPPPSIADAINLLALKSSGQFIYASTVVKFIGDEDHDPERRLKIILGTSRSTSSLAYAQLDQLYIEILSQQQNTRLLKSVFVLILAFGQINLDLTCRLLWIKKDDLKRKLRRTHSLLNISDSGIKPYHLSLVDFLQHKRRAGKYYVHPFLVTLVRLPLSVYKVWGIPYAKYILGGAIATVVGILIAARFSYTTWPGILQGIVPLVFFGTLYALVVGFIGLVLWMQREQKKAVIRELLTERPV